MKSNKRDSNWTRTEAIKGMHADRTSDIFDFSTIQREKKNTPEEAGDSWTSGSGI